jgi:hypothetical protein
MALAATARGARADAPPDRLAHAAWLKGVGPAFALAVVLVAAFALRVPSLRNPPTDFHVTRQYNGVLLAHSYYVDLSASATHQERVIAALDRPPVIEPPVLESATVLVDLALGHETLVFPRLVSVLAWVLAGLLLWRIARRFLTPLGSVVAVGLFELLPFAVLATRSFQPDPLAVAAMLVALLMSLRWAEGPTTARLAAAAASGAAAILLKADFAPFIVAGQLAASAMAADRRRLRSLLRPGIVAWLAVAMVPAALWSAFVSFSKESISQRIGTYFIGHYLVTATFWTHLGALLSGVFGLPVLLVGAAGLAVSRGHLRSLLMWSLAAYGVFAVAFDFKVAGHSYYQLPLVPFVALASGCAVEQTWRWVSEHGFTSVLRAGLAASTIAMAVIAVALQDRIPSSALGRQEVAAAEVVGRTLCHPTHAVFVDSAYGMPVEYHGDMAGAAWPSPADLAFDALHHQGQPGATERLASLRSTGSRYVVVTDEGMLSAEPALQAALQPYPTVMQGPGYRVLDLDPSLPSHCAGGPG